MWRFRSRTELERDILAREKIVEAAETEILEFPDPDQRRFTRFSPLYWDSNTWIVKDRGLRPAPMRLSRTCGRFTNHPGKRFPGNTGWRARMGHGR
jgi:hypothetical protein